MKTIEELEAEVERLKASEKTFDDALDYLERALPNGVQIVCAALANVPRDQCPAIQALWGGDDAYGW